MYYRITSKGTGVYQAFKEKVGQRKWQEVLKVSKWLPNPPNYKNNYRSYFTEEGFEKFKTTVFPVMMNYISITIKQFDYIPGITVYEDRYQIVKID